MDDLQDQIRRLRDQIRGLSEAVIDPHDEPTLSLMIALDWGDDELCDARDIFGRFEEHLHDSGTTDGFEQSMRERFLIDHQVVKRIILSFLAADEYPGFCRSFAKANPCSEFNSINDQ